MPHPRLAVAGVLVPAVAALAALLMPGSASAATVARTADQSIAATSALALINSVGVNVHTYYGDTAYADNARTISLLQNLGVRNVRDGLAPNRPDEVADLTALGRAGIRSELILSGAPGANGPTVDASQLAELDQLTPYVDAVEPTNEYDCAGDANWAGNLRSYSRSLVSALQASADTARVGILGPSFCQTGSPSTYGSINGTATVVNVHDYAGGQLPELAMEGRVAGYQRAEAPALPSVVTETGFQNATKAPGLGGQTAVTEATAADYTVRTLLDDSRLGIARTYLYELLDEKSDPGLTNPEEHYGLVRADGSVKPAYTAVQNLLADIAQGSPNSVQGVSAATAPAVAVQGGGSLLRSLVVSDPTGGGETVALWLADPLENPVTHARITDTPATVRLSVAANVTATTRKPSRGNAQGTLGTGSLFSVPVNGAVTLVHLAPTGVTTTRTVVGTRCTTQPGYAALAAKLGATTASDLSPAPAWSGTPGAAAGLPNGITAGSVITADDQQRHVAVPGAPTTWTIAVWERTDASSAQGATFLHASGAGGALLRTYDLQDDAPSHMQLSAYGLPTSAGGFGSETWGQALPGTWHLLTLTESGPSARFAVDGITVGTVTSSSYPLSGVDVGSLTGGFRGALGGLEVFPKALTPAQVVNLATTAPSTC